ncbi:MAG: hypothetical protein HQL89_03150 [Magnetococcales bacterium]|nr:hypothetical protein [Magnetococcales bacterium]
MLLIPWWSAGAEEWFPPLVEDARGRVPLVREALHFRACGDKAFVALVDGGWYWRHVETGKVVPLPQLDASLTRMDTDYFIGCSRDGMDLYYSNLEKKKGAQGRYPGTTLFQIKNRRTTIISNVRLFLNWSPSGKYMLVIWSGMKPNPKDKRGIYVRFPKGLNYIPAMTNLGDLRKGEWVGQFFVRWWEEIYFDLPEVLLFGSMLVIEDTDQGKPGERKLKRIHGYWSVNKETGSFKLEDERIIKDKPENCQNWHCYDAIQLGEIPSSHKYIYYGVFRQHNWEGPMQFRERMVTLDVDQPGDTLVEGSFLHEQINDSMLFYDVNTKNKRTSIWMLNNIVENDGIETNDFGPIERLVPPPVPENVAVDRLLLEDPGYVDPELFPSMVTNHQERILLAQQVSGWEVCGDHALVLNVKGSWYWRDIQTGQVVRLPQEINRMTPVHCSPDSQDIYLKISQKGGMFLYRIQEGRVIQIAQNGLNLTWSSDGRKVAMVWSGMDFCNEGTFYFEQPWIRFPENTGYRPVLLSPTRLHKNTISELDRNIFQWLPGDRYLFGPPCSEHPSGEKPLGLWDTGDEGVSLDKCEDWSMIDSSDWMNTLNMYYWRKDRLLSGSSDLEKRLRHLTRIINIKEHAVVSEGILSIHRKQDKYQKGNSCTLLWDENFFEELIQNRIELWYQYDYWYHNWIGKVDWETGKIVCRMDEFTNARFLNGWLVRAIKDDLWLEKIECR